MTVSAAIPCYRCAGTVRRAALSVARQTLRPLELILVDDASGHDTARVLSSVRDELGSDWVKIVSLKINSGASVARNAAWNRARGEYIAFLDADDSWLPQKLARQAAFMRAHAHFAISGHLAQYGEGAEPSISHAAPSRYRELSRLQILLKNPMVTPSLMMRRDLALRFDAGSRHMEDHRFLQEAVFTGLRVARLEEVLARVHKPAYGAGGLSADLLSMERAELDNYRRLRRAGHIGAPAHAALAAYSLLKFCRRATWVGLRRATSSR